MCRSLALSVVVGLVVVASLGCAGPRQVLRERDFGIIAIPANTNTWPFRYRDKAAEMMAQHFPEGYEVVREEEVKVGEYTTVDRDHDTRHLSDEESPFQVDLHSESTRVSSGNLTEYQITYQRRGLSYNAAELLRQGNRAVVTVESGPRTAIHVGTPHPPPAPRSSLFVGGSLPLE